MLQSDEAREQWRIAKIRARRFLKEWDESKHPRVPAGGPDGGQFGYGGGGDGGDGGDRGGGRNAGRPANADPRNPAKTKNGEWRIFYRGIWGPDKHDPEHQGPTESWTSDPRVAARYANEPNDPIRRQEFEAGGGTVTPRVLAAKLKSEKPFVITEKKVSISDMAERLRLDKEEANDLAADIDVEEAFEREDPKFEAWQYGDSVKFNSLLLDNGYDMIALPGAFIDPDTGDKTYAEEMRVLDPGIVERVDDEQAKDDEKATAGKKTHPGKGYSEEAYVKDGVIHTSNVYDAVQALHEDRRVELDQPRSVSILIDKLGEISKDMIAKGEKAPNFNLCRVTIKATSLFCADTMGLARVEMPQFPKDQDEPFRNYLISKGYKVEREEQYASYLRATQNELNGAKVAGIARRMRSPEGYGGNPIFVSDDDYILDGHHRWAAEVGIDAANNVLADSKKMAIWRVNASITTLLEEGEIFTGGKGKLAMDEDRKKRALRMLGLVERTSAHTDFMNECVPRLMDYGKDQIVAVAACLNMWREQWEESHPDGADDPGPSPKEADPDSPLAEGAAELKWLDAAREWLKVYNEADHPRDEYGRWTDGGSSDAPEGAPARAPAPAPPRARETASAKPIKGLPNDIVINDRLLSQAQERGAFEMTAKEKGKEGSGRERYEVTVTATIPKGVKSFQSRESREFTTYYDPELADLRTHNLGEKYLEFTVAEPKAGLSTEIEPLPDSDVIYRGMRAEEYEEFMRTGLIESSGSYNMEGQEGLTYWATDPATAASYANGFAPWPHKATFEKPAYVVATKMPKETRKVEGTGDNEVGVARPIAKTEIMGVWRGDVYQHTPGTADIKPSSYDPNESSYEGGSSSGVSSDVVWKRVGIGVDDIKKPYTDEQVANAMESALKSTGLLKGMAASTATKLDFNPELIEYSDEDKEFTLGGMSYKYAGSYTRGESKIKLYNNEINAHNIKGITAHEIGHRKFELLRDVQKVERAAMFADPGPPPDPNHQYWWGRKGGNDAVMKPDGTLREPYDKKYPVYNEWARLQMVRPSLEQDDGITDYSKAYWSEWEKGQMPVDKAYHETMAEMSRNFGTMGKHSAVTSKSWRDLYALQEKVWAETDKAKRDVSGPVKAIFILDDGVRWEIR